MTITELVTTVFGSTAAALTVTGILAKLLIEKQFKRSFENFRSKLEAKSASLKTELSIYAHEQNVGLSRIDDQRSKAIQAIYNLITQWQDAFLTITSSDDNFDITPEHEYSKFYDLAEKIAKLSEKLSISIRNHAIYFDEKTFNKISKYGSTLTEIGLNFYSQTFEDLDIASTPDYSEVAKLVREAKNNLLKSAKGDVEILRDTLLYQFRLLMKSDKNSTNNLIRLSE